MSDDGLPTAPAPRALASEFLTSADRLEACPRDDVVEVAFAGRSNAGKSSTLNRLAGRRQLARVSKTPGRTQLINFFSVNDGGRLVDLPGYGYARAAKSNREAWGQAVDEYLSRRTNLVCVVLVMDARHPLKPFDRQMIDWCTDRSMPLLVLLNKADKLKRGERKTVLRSLETEVPPATRTLLFSAATGLGAADAVAAVREHLNREHPIGL
ncbi:MAG: ribosome biogenesis GTP-binding protein YihA/YsxC [Gammaproteobacteria bacterium]|nr:ribosome biogenesis GTP-binding protein YihA/YsxC [Gammaproteobacteria bacterium]